MSKVREFLDSKRDQHAPKFDSEHDPKHEKFYITYDGPIVCTVSLHDCGLPPGFQMRLAAHVMDLLTGRRTALWDEQAIYGEHPRDPAHTRVNAARVADHLAKQREFTHPQDAHRPHHEPGYFYCASCGESVRV